MTYILRHAGWPCFIDDVPPELRKDEGCFLVSYFDTKDGYGDIKFSRDVREAMQFATAGEALTFWKTQSRNVPFRPDGRPNRPMTAFNGEILSMADAITFQFQSLWNRVGVDWLSDRLH